MNTEVNPLLAALRLPGETVALPSRAKFYEDMVVHPDVKAEGEVHVHPMTTYEELLMKSPDLLFSGQAIIQTFARCIPQIINPLEMYSKDIDFLLIALRKVTYGAEINVQYTHNCLDAKQHTYKYDVSEFIRSARSIEGKYEPKSSKIKLTTKQTVEIRPFIFRDVIAASQRASTLRVEGLSDLEFVMATKDMIIDSIHPAILRVDNTDNKEFIREWLETLPPPLIAELAGKVEKINEFGADMTIHTQCQDCGKDIAISVPLNPQSFFILPSELVIAN
jgi:hypothetical protein